MKKPIAWILGVLAVAACGNESGAPGTGGPGTTGAGGTSATTGGATTTTGNPGPTSSTTSGNTTGSGGNATGPTTGPGPTTSGSGGSGGAAVDGGGGGSMKDASTGIDVINPATCSDPGPNPTPRMGFTPVSNPPDAKFPFTTHWMGMFADDPTKAHCISMTSLTDLDRDGDLDFADGQRDVACSGQTNPGAPMIWWEYCSPDHWVRHTVGTGFASAASGGAGDFDGDGWIDLVTGNSWFKNPGAGVRTAGAWTRYPTGAPGSTEEITIGDLNGDGKLDAMYLVNGIDPQWWTPGANATAMWTRTNLSTYRQQQGGAIGDLDGDGKLDAIAGDHWWYKQGANNTWTPIPFSSSPMSMAFVALSGFEPANTAVAGSSPLTMVADVDGDGDYDIAMSTHWGTNVAWMENRDGKGTTWALHVIPPTSRQTGQTHVLHDVVADDFDNDGDIDILVAENQGSMWIYENTDGKGGAFTEHMIATGPGHEARAADVDCDGDLDIVGKSWSDPNDGSAGSSEIANLLGHHVYYKNELVEKGGKAVFDRPKSEVWNVPNKGRCK